MKSVFTIHRTNKHRDESLPLHTHQEGQLTFAASGIVQVYTDEGRWLVPSRLAAWISPGSCHRIEMMTDAELWIIHWKSAAIQNWGARNLLKRSFVLQITPLLQALLNEAVSVSAHSQKAQLIVRLILHELTAMPAAPTFLPMPNSPIGRRAADIILADQRNTLSLEQIAAGSASSIRTVSRLFPIETGLTLKAWHQRARIVRTMDQLSRGDKPSVVARKNGFANTAAFSFAFRQVTGITPTVFTGGTNVFPDVGTTLVGQR